MGMDMQELTRLVLADGIPAEAGGRALRYRVARLRETTVADERRAQRAAERAVRVDGQWKLLVSDAEFHFALTALHVEAFEQDGQRIDQALLGDGWLDVVGKLSTHDRGLIEQRIFLLEMAAELRYGHISQADWDQLVNGQPGQAAPEGHGAPQPVGEGAGLREAGAGAVGRPALLADYVGGAAHGPAALDGR